MKYLMFFLASIASAQTLTLTAAKTALAPGEQTVVTATLAGQASPIITVLQVDLAAVGITEGTRNPGAATMAAGKVLRSNATRTVVLGVNATQAANNVALQNGILWTSTITAGTTLGPASLKLSGIQAVRSSAALVPVASGPDLNITIAPAKEDLNGDGKIDMQDLEILVLQNLMNACTTGDQNGDGLCDARDLQIIINKML